MASNSDPMTDVVATPKTDEDARVKEVERVLNCKPGDWYSILNVEPNCKPLAARRAAIKSLLLIKDRFEAGPEEIKAKANQATKWVSEAQDNLKAGESYVEVDENDRATQAPPQSEPYSPSPAMQKIYKQATESVLVLFSGAEDTSLAELAIHQYNEDIRDLVRKENSNATILQQISGFIDLKTILSHIKLRKDHKALKQRDTTNLSESEKGLSVESTRHLGLLGWAIKNFNERKGYPSEWNWDKDQNPEVWASKPEDTTQSKATFPPGQTADGDTILGYLPILKMKAGDEVVERCRFVVEVDDEENLGNIKIMTWGEVGHQAGNAYIEQAEGEKLFIANSKVRYSRPRQRDTFQKLLGFWANYSATDRWNTAYCWIELKDGKHDVVSRGCFELIVGADRAMVMIKDLFDNDESKFIWRIPPKTSKHFREGPHGLVPIQKRRLIENGTRIDEPVLPEKTVNMRSQNSKIDKSLAIEVEKLRMEGESNKAEMLKQTTELQTQLAALMIEVRKMQPSNNTS